jgi:hypothetical protein
MSSVDKIVHIFRHGEVERANVVDPPLTSNGEQRAKHLIYELPYSMKAPTLVVVSPLKRCIQTALLFHREFNTNIWQEIFNVSGGNMDCSEIIQHLAIGNITFMVDPRLQEVGQPWESSDRNKMPSRREMQPFYKNSFIFPEEFYPAHEEGQCDDPDKDQDWYKEIGLWSGRLQSPGSLERAASFKEFLYNRPEKEIIVVTSNAFIDLLVHEHDVDMNYLESRSCVWKRTVSGRMRLVPLTFPESKMDIVRDEDYSEIWPYRLSERSELFNKWYRIPTQAYESLLQFEACKKYLGLNKLTLDKAESELGPEDTEKVKRKVKTDMASGHLFELSGILGSS